MHEVQGPAKAKGCPIKGQGGWIYGTPLGTQTPSFLVGGMGSVYISLPDPWQKTPYIVYREAKANADPCKQYNTYVNREISFPII